MLNYHFRVFNGCLFGEFPNQAQPCILPPLDCVGLSVAHHHHHQRTIPEDVLMFQLLSSSGQIHNSYAFHSPPKFCLCDARCATLASSLLFMWSSSIGDESYIGDIIYHVHLHVLSSFVDLNSHSWSIPKFHLSSLCLRVVFRTCSRVRFSQWGFLLAQLQCYAMDCFGTYFTHVQT